MAFVWVQLESANNSNGHLLYLPLILQVLALFQISLLLVSEALTGADPLALQFPTPLRSQQVTHFHKWLPRRCRSTS